MNDLEQRVQKLEDDYVIHTQNSLTILKKIEKRLVGDIESNVPGLLDDVRQLKLQTEKNEQHIAKLTNELELITKKVEIYSSFSKDIETLKSVVDSLNKNKWLIQGGLIVVGIIIGKIDWIWKLLFKGN